MTSTNNQQALKKEAFSHEDVQKCCADIEKEFKAFQNDLNFIILIGDIQSTEDTLLKKQSQILALPSGQKLHNRLKAYVDQNENNMTGVVGIAKETQKTFMGFSSKNAYHPLVYVKASSHNDLGALKAEIYANVWKALSVIDDDKRENEECLTRDEDLIIPNWNDLQITSRNMLADIFAGSQLEASGQNGALKAIAKKRCKSCFEDLKNYDAAANPFPIMLETVQMVFDDVNHATSNTNTIMRSLSIVSEVIDTMDENTIKRWREFIDAAQEMAWGKQPTTQILGAAIYTSDNVYNRTSAYMIADILNTNPTPNLQFEGFNAFADIENQQRTHKISCLETLEHLEGRPFGQRNPQTYFKMAIHSCNAMLEGTLNGFCAPALYHVGQNIDKTPDITKQEVAAIFSQEMNALPWLAIRNMHKEIIFLKKNNKEISLKTIIEILRRDTDTREAAIAIKALSEMDIEIEQT